MTRCDFIIEHLHSHAECISTPDGARISTQCLYPSFDRVFVYIMAHGDGFKVHDGAEAMACSWQHGRDDAKLTRLFNSTAKKFDCSFEDSRLVASAPSLEWLEAAVLSVANAAADAANAAVGKSAANYTTRLVERIERIITNPESLAGFDAKVKTNINMIGSSGKSHNFDFLVQSGDNTALIDAVTPHHNSIASKYVAFSDTNSSMKIEKFAVYERELASEDKILMSNVADLIHVSSLEKNHGATIFRNLSNR